MRYSTDWKDYELIDASSGERLERWGDIILIRPDPQIIWNTPRNNPLWRKAHARYHRSSSGGGQWEVIKKFPDVWQVRYKSLTFNIKPMGFKHTGLFPEQAVNWDDMAAMIRKAERPVKVLNLFAYTGGATLACLSAGANVCHPPSYGRGPGGEVWKLEEQIYSLVELCSQVLTDSPLFFNINSYTTGLSPSVMNYLNGAILKPKFGGTITADEIGLPVTQTGLILPCGATASWRSESLED